MRKPFLSDNALKNSKLNHLEQSTVHVRTVFRVWDTAVSGEWCFFHLPTATAVSGGWCYFHVSYCSLPMRYATFM